MGNMHDKLDEIVQCVIKHGDMSETGLMDGRCGVILLMYYYAKNVNPEMVGLADNYIHCLFEGLRNTTIPINYAEGIAGVVATIAHLKKQRLCPKIRIEREISEFLLSETKKELEADNFDFFYGSAGLLYSMLLHHECDGSLKELLKEAVMALSSSSITDNTYITSNYASDFETGFPHGYASWVVILSKLIKHNVAIECCKMIVKRIVDVYIHWLDLIGTNENDSLFPTSIDLRTPKASHSRLGWCNGDYPCLYSLLYYARVVNDLSLQARLEPLVPKLLSRRKLINNGVLDAGICHGASGIVMIISGLCQTLPYGQSYENDLLFWSDILIGYSHNDTPETAGFLKMYYKKGDVIVSEKSFGLLEGLSGIGLTLIGLLYKEQAWDELFLLS